jgi:hypothetical protein
MNNATVEKLKMVQADLKNAFKVIGEKHGISINTGTLTYNELYFTMPVKGRFLDALGTTEEADKEEFKNFAPKFGIDPSIFGNYYSIGGKTYRIVGIAPKARKYPVIGENGGKKYKLEAVSVNFAVAQAKKDKTA